LYSILFINFHLRKLWSESFVINVDKANDSQTAGRRLMNHKDCIYIHEMIGHARSL